MSRARAARSTGVPAFEPPPREVLRANLTSRATWVRVFHMAIFVVAFVLASVVLAAVLVFQLGAMLLAGEPNANLIRLGHGLATYVHQILLFVTFNREARPYPFADWPG
jgi:hypothetical protein